MLLRILADGRPSLGSAGVINAWTDDVRFALAEGAIAKLTIDYTGFLGSETLSSVTWTDVDSATATSEATSGAYATALITIPGSGVESDTADDQAYRIRVVAVTSGGRRHSTLLWFVSKGR